MPAVCVGNAMLEPLAIFEKINAAEFAVKTHEDPLPKAQLVAAVAAVDVIVAPKVTVPWDVTPTDLTIELLPTGIVKPALPPEYATVGVPALVIFPVIAPAV